jgi:hypothetical protein
MTNRSAPTAPSRLDKRGVGFLGDQSLELQVETWWIVVNITVSRQLLEVGWHDAPSWLYLVVFHGGTSRYIPLGVARGGDSFVYKAEEITTWMQATTGMHEVVSLSGIAL